MFASGQGEARAGQGEPDPESPEAGDASGDPLEDEFALLEEEDLAADEITSASKRRQSIFFSPSAITVLTREEIQASGALTLADVLRRVPGMDVFEMKPSFPLVGCRALTESSNNLVLLLVDGREALSELAGWPIWAGLTFDLEEVERVEIIRGPGSTLYGANAFAAVVNVTTVGESAANDGQVLAYAGELNNRRLFGRIRQAWELEPGTLSFSAGLGMSGQNSSSSPGDEIIDIQTRSHAVVRYRQGRRLDVSLHGGLVHGEGTILMILGDFQASGVLNHYAMAKVRSGLTDKLELETQIYHSRFYGLFHFRSDIRIGERRLATMPDFSLDSNTVDGKAQLEWSLAESLRLIGGGNLRYSMLESDVAEPPQYDETRGALFAHAQWNAVDELQLTGGFRVDLNSVTPGAALSPRVVAVWRPWADQSFRLGYGLAFRKPSFAESQLHVHVVNAISDEVAAVLARSVGNPDLRNEKVHSVEGGWRGRFPAADLQVSLDFFFNTYQDTIYFDPDLRWRLGLPDLGQSRLEFVNQEADLFALGGEAELEWTPRAGLTVWGNLGLRRLFAAADVRQASEPSLRANLGVRWSGADGPLIDVAVHYVSAYRMPAVDPLHPIEQPELTELGDAWLIVGRLGYRLGISGGRSLEAGLVVRSPLGLPFREFPGVNLGLTDRSQTAADFGGEVLVRQVSLYARAAW